MNIILKNSINNIFGKPFRTLLVTFAIFVCSLCAMLCFDMCATLQTVVDDMFGSISRADLAVYSDGRDLYLPGGFPESDILGISQNTETVYKEIEGEYGYVSTEEFIMLGIDIDDAVSMEFIDPVELSCGEIILSGLFAGENGYSVGDKMTVHDLAGEEVELTVAGILPASQRNAILAGGNKGIINSDTADLLSCGRSTTVKMLIDVRDDSQIEAAQQMISEQFPGVSVMPMSITGSQAESLNELRAFFFLLFAVTFLLVVFVTASICNRIAGERMPFIGTLRSLGMSTLRTGLILLLENVLYAILGSIPAVIIYSLVRDPMMSSMFVIDGEGTEGFTFAVPPLSVFLIIGVVAGAVMIECLIPLRTILKALGTSIRDIIFDNRDTAYRFSRTAEVIGLVSLAASLVSLIFRKNLAGAAVCMVTAVTALALLFPYALRYAASLIGKAADRKGNAKWALASVEAISRKSTVGSGVLCATAAAMCIIVFFVASSLTSSMEVIPYDCDVVVNCTGTSEELSFIEHLDGVTGTESVYTSVMEFSLGDEEKITSGMLCGMPDGGYGHYNAYSGLPSVIEDGTVYVDRRYAQRKGIETGDDITVTIDPDGVFPLARTYTVAGMVEGCAFDTDMEALIVSLDEYMLICRDRPGYILVSCTDPEGTARQVSTYGGAYCSDASTLQQVIERNRSTNSRITVTMTAIMAVALGMTFTGMVSNQLIGFEGRKKECAVMLSTAMGSKTLSGILLREVLMTSALAAVTGTLAGTALTKVIAAAVANSESLIMTISVDPAKAVLFAAGMIVLFSGTVIFPIRNLRKMKISEQIKYE